ncbi:MAG: SDR family oxidoreductase [Blastocatellia bacterium]|nr:SDR family oxidoreductase [Blastocatellia bacterium]
MNYVVVTGVSTGIGWAITKTLTLHGMHVFGSVRKQADADKLAQEFGASFTPLLFDVTDEAAVHEAAKLVRQKLNGQTLFGLVNNAGIAVPGPLLHLPIAELRNQLEINVIGQAIVTQAFAPLLGADRRLQGKPGRVVNISSVAGKMAMPFVGPYAMSKHALEAFSESLRRELMLYGIDVIIIGPGSIVTPIWDKAQELDITPFLQTDYGKVLGKFREFMVSRGKAGLPVEQMGELTLQVLTTPKPKVRYTIVANKFKNWTLPRLLPKRMFDNLIAKQLGFK